jgi:hypothetical protein
VATFTEGEKVWAPDPDGGGPVPATFLTIADPDECLMVQGVKRDAAWISLDTEEGGTAKVPYFELRSRD